MRLTWLALILLGLSFQSHAVGRLADVEIMDRETGQTLPVYRSHGEYWVAGNPGARYAVVIRNQRGQRVLAVTSVDGLNVISGETAAWRQSGYVFDPWQRYAVDGWRKSPQEVAAFNFTSLPDSYASRTGRPANVGVIGIALFLEKPPAAPADVPTPPIAAPAEPSSLERLTGRQNSARAQAPERRERAASDLANSQLGTGHGPREQSYVSSTQFERLSSSPDEIIRIRYDRLENLVAMGVVKPTPAASLPNPFPDSGFDRFVPDPPGL